MFFETLEERGYSDLIVPVPFKITSCDLTDKLIEWFSDIIKNNRRVIIEPDGDVDGVLSAKIVSHTFNLLGHSNYFVDNLLIKSHTVGERFIRTCLRENIDYAIIVDSSSNNLKLINSLDSLGVKVIILDHHVQEFDINSDNVLCINSSSENSVRNHISAGYLCFEEMSKVLGYYGFRFNPELFTMGYITLISDSCNISNQFGAMATQQMDLYKTSVPTFIGKFFNEHNKCITRGFLSFGIINKLNACMRRNRFDIIHKFIFDENLSMIDEIQNIYEESKKLSNDLTELADVNEYNDFVICDINKSVKLLNLKGLIDIPNYTGLVAQNISSKYNKICMSYLNLDINTCKGSVRDLYSRKILNMFSTFMYARGHNSAFGVKFNYSELEEIIKSIGTFSPEFKKDKQHDIVFDINPNITKQLRMIAEYNEVAGFEAPYSYLSVKVKDCKVSVRPKITYLDYNGITIQSFEPLGNKEVLLAKPILTNGEVRLNAL